MKKLWSLSLLLSVLFWVKGAVQGSDTLRWRRWVVVGLEAGGYGAGYYALSRAWYSQFERSAFHLFDDGGEWLQMDKAGHIWSGYWLTLWHRELLAWAGFRHSKEWAVVLAMGSLLLVEVQDGFSVGWGFSVWDLLADAVGSAIAYMQIRGRWDTPVVWLKYSYHDPVYPEEKLVRERVENLYGRALPQRMLKDYNGQTIWLSVSAELLSVGRLPGWLAFSVGYSAEGMLGGFANRWVLSNGDTVGYSGLERVRQFIFSVDVDWSRVPVRWRGWRVVGGVLNMFKFPAPALLVESSGRVRFSLLYW